MSDSVSSGLTEDWIEAWSSRSSLEFMAWMREQGITVPHVELLGYEVVRMDEGDIELRWRVPSPLLNPAGIAHGGFLAAMLDDACGMAISAAYDRWVPLLTVQLSVDYLAPVHADRDHVVHGVCVRRGRSTSLADATITDPDGTLLARGTGVFQPNRHMVPREHWDALGM